VAATAAAAGSAVMMAIVPLAASRLLRNHFISELLTCAAPLWNSRRSARSLTRFEDSLE
jgi:hypothetical protein